MEDVLFQEHTPKITHRIERSLWNIPHFHREVELIYVIDGRGEALVDKNTYPLERGDLFVAFPNQIHSYKNKDGGTFAIIILSPDIFYNLKSPLFDLMPERNVVRVENTRLREIVTGEGVIPSKFSETLLVGRYNEAMAYILDSLRLVKRYYSNSTVTDILGYCASNFTQPLTLDTVAEALHISKYHISYIFNNKLRLPFNTYLNNLRLNYACEMLKNGEMKIADISEESGFGSLRSFNRTFLATLGVTPYQYREKHRAPDTPPQSI